MEVEDRVMLCSKCFQECQPKLWRRGLDYFTSSCCDADIYDDEEEPWNQGDLAEIAAARSEMAAESEAEGQAHG